MTDLRRDFATEVVRRLAEAGHTALWAGGCVRDCVMGRHPKDYDVATSALPEEVRTLFGRRRTLAVGQSFGVIIVLGATKAAGQVEVATFRSEGRYLDGRRPESVSFCAPDEDAQRRDFTINGMFYDPLTDILHDYVGGERDLGEGIVRAIGDPRERMTEDKLRMLRAVRFVAAFDFELERRTEQAIRDLAAEILIVSWERIAQELRRMLVDRHRERAMRLCHELGLLMPIVPELAAILAPDTDSRDWWHTLHVLGNLEQPTFELATAALLRTIPSPVGRTSRQAQKAGTVHGVCRRLRLSNKEVEHITWLVGHLHAFDEAESMPLATLKRLLAHPESADLLQLARLSTEAEQHDPRGIEFAEDYRNSTPLDIIQPPELLTGEDLHELEVPPGPHFRRILGQVRESQLNEQILTRAEALDLARQLSIDLPTP